MKKIIMLISALAVLLVAMSGCVDNTDNPEAELSGVAGLVIVDEAPEGFEYLGSPSISVDDIKEEYADVPGIVDAAEGIYQNPNLLELHVTAVEMENSESAENLVNEYKESFSQLRDGTRFTDVSFNDHMATRIKDYVDKNGEQLERYTYIWNNENFVFIIEGNTDDHLIVRSMAEATGN